MELNKGVDSPNAHWINGPPPMWFTVISNRSLANSFQNCSSSVASAYTGFYWEFPPKSRCLKVFGQIKKLQSPHHMNQGSITSECLYQSQLHYLIMEETIIFLCWMWKNVGWLWTWIEIFFGRKKTIVKTDLKFALWTSRDILEEVLRTTLRFQQF